jgi:glycosyltransferase involved in cell wall biosynthesis
VDPRTRARLDADVDVMLQDELAHPTLVGANPRLPYPVVSVVHHLRASERTPLSGLYRAVERRYLETVDAVVCNSEATRRTVADTGGPDRCVVAPPAGDRFDPDVGAEDIEARAHEGPLRVAFVGNLIPRKGLHTLVEAVAAVEGCELTAVGRPVDDGYARRVRERVRRRGVGDRVDLAGELADEELAATLRESHVLAVPSTHEGFGIVYLEGMSFGLPAVATDDGGATEVVDRETGALVPPASPGAVAHALRRFADDRDRLARAGVAARRRYETHPGWPETTARVRGLLADVAGVSA